MPEVVGRLLLQQEDQFILNSKGQFGLSVWDHLVPLFWGLGWDGTPSWEHVVFKHVVFAPGQPGSKNRRGRAVVSKSPSETWPW